MAQRSHRRKGEDAYYQMAKASGYRSRSSYKLLQMNERYRFIRRGAVVVDLGAAPGGWLQVAAEMVGDSGMVFGLDLDPIIPLGLGNVRTLQGDLTSSTSIKKLIKLLPRKADVLLSDASPHVSGNWGLDQARQLFLTETSLEACRELLEMGGNAVFKAFQGADYQRLLGKVRSAFRSVDVSKPSASRKGSAEVYWICRGFLGSEGLI